MFGLMSRTMDVVYFSERERGAYDKHLVCLFAIGVYLLTLSLALHVQVLPCFYLFIYFVCVCVCVFAPLLSVIVCFPCGLLKLSLFFHSEAPE